jgi:hypothetical protein
MPPINRTSSINLGLFSRRSALPARLEAEETLGGLRRLLMACELDELARTLSRERELTQPNAADRVVRTPPMITKGR